MGNNRISTVESINATDEVPLPWTRLQALVFAALAEARRAGESATERWRIAAKDLIGCVFDPYGRGKDKDWNTVIRELIDAEHALIPKAEGRS